MTLKDHNNARKRWHWVFTATLFWFLLTALTWQSMADAGDDIVVIAHPSMAGQTVDKSSVRSIFGMRSRNWPSGAKITVFVLDDDHPTHVRFTKDILRTFPHNLRRIWDRRVFSGVGQAPTDLETEDDMVNEIATSTGAIGYVHRSKVDDRVVILELEQ